jgi:hypothetical protein
MPDFQDQNDCMRIVIGRALIGESFFLPVASLCAECLELLLSLIVPASKAIS